MEKLRFNLSFNLIEKVINNFNNPILNKEEIKEFSRLTEIKATTVFISKGKRYYYAIIVDNNIKIRLSNEFVKKLI